MKTYLKLVFSSEGQKPSKVMEVLYGLGFEPQKGEYDMVYRWNDGATLQETIWFADKIHATLNGLNVCFYMETSD